MSVCGLVEEDESGISNTERSLETTYNKNLGIEKANVSCRLPYSSCLNKQALEGMIGQSLMLQTSRHASRYVHNAVNLL